MTIPRELALPHEAPVIAFDPACDEALRRIAEEWEGLDLDATGVARWLSEREGIPMSEATFRVDRARIQALKQASRDEDARAVAAGELTLADLDRKNAFLDPKRTVVRWDRSGRL